MWTNTSSLTSEPSGDNEMYHLWWNDDIQSDAPGDIVLPGDPSPLCGNTDIAEATVWSIRTEVTFNMKLWAHDSLACPDCLREWADATGAPEHSLWFID